MFAPCQASSCLGSFCGRPAFIGKSVFGRFSVFFSSSGSAMIGALVNPFYAVLGYRCTAGNNAKQCKDVCYNGMTVGVSRLRRATFPGQRESYRLGTPKSGKLRLK